MMNENGRPGTARGERRLTMREAWRAARRRPLLAAGVPLVLLASTGFFLWWAEPTYEASATLRVDQDRSGVAIIEALQTLSSGSKISTEMEELRSRTLAEEVVDSLSLHVAVLRPRKVARSALFSSLDAATSAPAASYVIEARGDGFRISDGTREWAARANEPIALPGLRFTLAPAAAEHDRVVLEVEPFQEAVRDYLRKSAVARPNREADIIRIRYEGRDRDIVREVPNVAARRFIARRNDVRTREARSTAEFLEWQIGALNAQLGVAEDELRDYRERFGVVSIQAEGEAQVSRLAEMQAEREMLVVERNSLQQVIDGMGLETVTDGPSPYRTLLGFPTMLRSIAASDLLRSLHEIEAERAKFLDRRTLQDPEVRVLTDQIRAIDAQLRGMATTYLTGVTAQIANLDRTLAGFTAQLQQIPEKELQLARLRRQTAVGEELYSQLQLRLKEAEIMAAVDDPSVRVVDPAIAPRRPIRPDVPLTVGLAMLFGLVLGIGGAVAREQLDDTVRTRDELQLLAGAPVLGSIPRIEAPALAAGEGNGDRRERRPHGSERVAARLAADVAGSPVIEAYRSLRTNINYSQVEQRPRVLVITSPAPGDGKSTTAANLAATMAKQGLSCLLVDADLRRGRLHDVFGFPREPGLSNVLMSERLLAAAVRKVEGMPDFLSTGTLPPNPAELLGSARMTELLKGALENYETIVLDAPPMNLVTDAAVLARSADGVIVVARAGVTPRDAITYTFDQLSGVRARVLGSVLNDADVRRENHYGSYMQAYYHTST